METSLVVPQGTFELQRHPYRAGQPLRAWDAADEYLLATVADSPPLEGAIVAIVNDGFGALTVALADRRPHVVSELATGRIALRANLERNRRPAIVARSILDPVPERIDHVLVKIPRSAGQLEEQLHVLRPRLHADSTIVGAGMTRHVHRSTLSLFERLVGPTETSLARKKARLLFSSFDPDLPTGENPWPTAWTDGPLRVVSHGGVFSSGGVDDGTRLLIEHLPRFDGAHVVDLGCGNGVLGATIARENPDAHVTFLDDARVAVASAEATWKANQLGDRARFIHSDRLDGSDLGPVDAVVCNPPFHAGGGRGDDVAWQMFGDSRRALRAEGELWVVGNRHLGYHAKLKKRFGNCSSIAANQRFVVLSTHR